MGFLDNVRARLRNNEDARYEEEFERAFRDGSWPEGVDLTPLDNTGAFLPATYDIDPLADASLPGNALAASRRDVEPYGGYTPAPGAHMAPAHDEQPQQSAAASAPAGGQVLYFEPASAPAAAPAPASGPSATTQMYAVPAAESPFQVIDGSMRPRAAASQSPAAAGQGMPSVESQPAPGAPAPRRPTVAAPAYEETAQQWAQQPVAGTPAQETPRSAMGFAPAPRGREVEDDGVQVFSRKAGEQRPPRTEPTPRSAQKPFADRLRERVAAAGAAAPARNDEGYGRPRGMDEGRRGAPAPMPGAPRGPREVLSAADMEFEDRRRARRASQERAGGFDAERVERSDRAPERGFDRGPEWGAAGRAQGQGRHPGRGGEPWQREERLERERPEQAGRYDRRYERETPRAPEPARRGAAGAGASVPTPCIVLKPRNYDVVSEIAQGVIAERRPTVLAMRMCHNDLIRRVLDFSFGLCCASGANLQELGERTYVLLPRGTALAPEDLAAMRQQNILRG